jgi:hypothetical protein
MTLCLLDNKEKFAFSGLCLMLLLSTNCVNNQGIGDDEGDTVPDTTWLSSNYSLSLEGALSTYSDEDIAYDFCTDVSTRSISTYKLYGDSTVVYEVILSPLNIVNQPKVLSYAFYVYWNRFEETDLSLYNAVTDIIQGHSSRKYHLQFSIRDEEVSYSNSFFYTDRTTNIDSDSDSESILRIPENIDCRVYGERVGELNFQYSGFVYSNGRADSLFVDYFDLQLFLPLSL